MSAGPKPPTSTPNKSCVAQFDVLPFSFSSSHFSDSGTKTRMKKVRSAGTIPRIIITRQQSFAVSFWATSAGSPSDPTICSRLDRTLVIPKPTMPTSR